MDETPVYFDMVPSKTVDVKGKKTIKVRTTGSEKRHITVVLACMSSGEFLPPMIIFKGKTDRTIRNLRVPEGYVVATQSKAWMDEVLMLRWIKEIWIPHVMKKGGRESILCLDSFRAHLTDEVISEFRTQRIHKAVIPGGCTSILQPLDVSLNKPFKAILRSLWQQYILEETEKAEASSARPQNLPAPSRQHLVDWIAHAMMLMDTKHTCVVKSFYVTGISNANGTWEERMYRDDQLRAEIDEEMEAVFGTGQLASLDSDSDESDDPLATDSDDSDVN